MSASLGASGGISVSGPAAAALTILAVEARNAGLLAPIGAATAAVGDILAAAQSTVATIANTANAALANFLAPINDPVALTFSAGQPYAGAFITTPTFTQIAPLNFSASLSFSTQALALMSPFQIAALEINTGITIVTDANLAAAFGMMFSNVTANFTLGFSINLGVSAMITPIPAYIGIGTEDFTYAMMPFTPFADQLALGVFVSSIALSFPNVIGIEGVAASVWVGTLGVSVGAQGSFVSGIPPQLAPQVYTDINTAANTMVPQTPVALVDYSYQQNYLNTVVALAIDNGLTTTFTSLLTSSMVTPVTWQVIKNRLPSVAWRGDALMLNTMVTALGVANVPYPTQLMSTLLTHTKPTDAVSQTTTDPGVGNLAGGGKIAVTPLTTVTPLTGGTAPTAVIPKIPIVTVGGVTLTTTTTPQTTAQTLTAINSLLTTLNLTANTIFTQNTCTGVMCSQPILNASLIAASASGIAASLLATNTVALAKALMA